MRTNRYKSANEGANLANLEAIIDIKKGQAERSGHCRCFPQVRLRVATWSGVTSNSLPDQTKNRMRSYSVNCSGCFRHGVLRNHHRPLSKPRHRAHERLVRSNLGSVVTVGLKSIPCPASRRLFDAQAQFALIDHGLVTLVLAVSRLGADTAKMALNRVVVSPTGGT